MPSVSGATGKKPTHRGRKPSGKPGAQHLGALQQAHAAGDFKAAKSAALNYANALHAHLQSGQAQAGSGQGNGMTMDDQDTSADQMPQQSATPQSSPQPKAPSVNPGRARLAQLAMKRRAK